MSKRRTNKANDMIQLFSGIAIIILFNYVGQYVFHRFDLTSDKRYSLSTSSKKALENLKDIVFIKVYLKGDFPAPYEKLRSETETMLNQFKAYAGDNIQYQFINPSDENSKTLQKKIYKKLSDAGLQPSTIGSEKKGERTSKLIWPGAILSYKGKEMPVQLLKNQQGGKDIEGIINGSIENLEYNFMNAIDNLKAIRPTPIAFIRGHGELRQIEVADISKTLSESYAIDTVEINGKLSSLTQRDSTEKGNYIVIPRYKTIIIAKPSTAFSEKDKFIIDQYLMYGGSILWLIDPIKTGMDSLARKSTTIAMPYHLGLEDMLFQYGARINNDLVLDLSAAPIPMITGMVGNQPKTELFPWYYFPVVIPRNNNAIVNNLGPIKFRFVSSVDTVGDDSSIKKQVLLTSSRYSRKMGAPIRVSLNIMRYEPNPKQFAEGKIPIAVSLEGKFNSIFKNRIPPNIANSKAIAFKKQSFNTKQIIVGDGDVIRNDVDSKTRQYYKLGYDRYTKRMFDNKDFILNCVNYLSNDVGIMKLRSKNFKIRLLSEVKTKKQKLLWQVINMVSPLIFLILIGAFQFIIRKRKFTH